MMLDFKYRGLSDQQISAIKRDEKMMELLRDPKLFLGSGTGTLISIFKVPALESAPFWTQAA